MPILAGRVTASTASLSRHRAVTMVNETHALLSREEDSEPEHWFVRIWPKGAWKTSAIYVKGAIARNTRGYYVGCFTTGLVVVAAILLMGAVALSPLIFLRLAETSTCAPSPPAAGCVIPCTTPSVRARTRLHVHLARPPADVGEQDILLSSSGTALPPVSALPGFLNYTHINAHVSPLASVAGCSPRWTLPAQLVHPDTGSNTSVIVMVIDSARESEIGYGRQWGRRPLGLQETYVSASALQDVALRGGYGERGLLQLSVPSLLSGLGMSGGASSNQTAAAEQLLSLLGLQSNAAVTVDTAALLSAVQGLPFPVDALPPITVQVLPAVAAALSAPIRSEVIITDAVDAPAGKWPSLLGNVMVLEAEHVPEMLRRMVTPAIAAALDASLGAGLGAAAAPAVLAPANAALANFSYSTMQQYAMGVVAQHADRASLYLGVSDPTGRVTRWTDVVMDALGTYAPVTLTTPVGTALAGTRFIQLFLGIIFQTVVFVLALLGGVVIFSLMLGDAEAKTYEYGMLRALGLEQRDLRKVMAVQTVAFAVPGIVGALVIGAVLYIGVALGVGAFAETTISLAVPGDAVAYGVAFGIIMPTIANVLPVRRALSKSLRDALNVYHQSFGAVTVTFLQLEKLGLSSAQTGGAVVAVIVGVLTYIVVPLSFVLRRFDLFLGVLNAILLGMVLGLTLIGQTLQPVLERGVLYLMLLCAGTDRRLRNVVARNLVSHRDRNRKTAYMVSISIAFLVFAGSMFALQQTSIATTVRQFLGSDIVVSGPTFSQGSMALPQESLTEWGDATKARGDIAGYTFISHRLDLIRPIARAARTRASTLIGVPSARVTMYGVQRNFMDVAFGDEYAIASQASTAGLPAGSSLRTSLDSVSGPNTVKAMYDGAGLLSLPIEGSTVTSPPVLFAGEVPSPVYACSASIVSSAPSNATVQFAGYSECLVKCSLLGNVSTSTPGLCVLELRNEWTTLQYNAGKAYHQYVDVLVSEALRGYASADVNTPLKARYFAQDSATQGVVMREELLKARAMLSKSPGFLFSSYSQAAFNSPVLTRMQSMATLLQDAEQAVAAGASAGTLEEITADTETAPDATGSTASEDTSSSDSNSAQAVQDGSAGGTSSSAAWLWERSPAWGVLRANESGIVSDPAPSAPGTARNVTAILDGLAGTQLAWASLPASIMLRIGECRAASGVRVMLYGAGAGPTQVRLEAAASAAGPWEHVLSGELQATRTSSSSGGVLHDLRFPTYSAPAWRLTMLTSDQQAGSGSVQVADVALLLRQPSAASNSTSSCSANLIALSDAALTVPKDRMLVRLADGASSTTRNRVVNSLKSVLNSDDFTVQDVQELLDSTETAVLGLDIFFYFVTVLAFALCFFASWISFSSNVRDNAREVAIIRALGLHAAAAVRMYVYEALALVLAASTSGLVVGLLVSITLTLQFNLFTEAPFQLTFPVGLTVTMYLLCIAIAVVSAAAPARDVVRQSIAKVLKET